MKKYSLRFVRLMLGLFLYAVGAVFIIRANVGYHPYDILNAGLSNVFGMKLGTWTIITGFGFLLAAVLLGEKIGIGTILNMLLIGTFMNVIMDNNWIPQQSNFFVSLLFLLIGMVTVAFATFIYLGAEFCAGPRDSLMVAFMRKTGWSVGVCRVIIEGSVLVVGVILGGQAGIGTVITALGSGFIMQFIFAMIRFNPTQVKRETLDMTLKSVASLFSGK